MPVWVLPLALIAALAVVSRPETEEGASPPDLPRPVPPGPGPMALPPLPYGPGALAPWTGAESVRAHHDVLQAGYVRRTNALLDAGSLTPAQWSDLVFDAAGAQLHALYWENLAPAPTAVPPELGAVVARDFGSWDAFRAEFTAVGTSIKGSGWVVLAWWPPLQRLVLLPVRQHQNGWLPGSIPLLVCDVWEHAYYIDHPADRGAYLKGFWGHVDWSVVARRLAVAAGG